MRSPGIYGEGELRGQPANPGSPGKMAVKTECVCVCECVCVGIVLVLGLVLRLASNFGFCTTTFRTNDPSDKCSFGQKTCNRSFT